MGVTCSTVTGAAVFFTTSIMVSEIELRSFPFVSNEGSRDTLQELRFRPLQCDASKVRKNTLVLLVLIEVSTQDAHVFNAALKAVVVGIPSFRDPPT